MRSTETNPERGGTEPDCRLVAAAGRLVAGVDFQHRQYGMGLVRPIDPRVCQRDLERPALYRAVMRESAGPGRVSPARAG
jgi:hypothetical protein